MIYIKLNYKLFFELYQLIQKRREKRLGFRGIQDIKLNDFFAGFKWDDLEKKKYKPFFKPLVSIIFYKKFIIFIINIDPKLKKRLYT